MHRGNVNIDGGWVENPVSLRAWTLFVKPTPIKMGPYQKTNRDAIAEVLTQNGEKWDDIEHCTLASAELDQEYKEYGELDFRIWTIDRIYFAEYCCCHNIIFVERNPACQN